ncbi:hypothetical protein JOC37_000073 [Desulfohalotomaculum tongense]|uniref:hypothetical protein n=1 Tax=Desulforadius tongensis TaxID=1216062 RepID=UPI0019565984|nr:hypothetical protein [Desulforadius tongensis]MBM7853708.1 hypothetical protein [Desulforadius tongensis]
MIEIIGEKFLNLSSKIVEEKIIEKINNFHNIKAWCRAFEKAVIYSEEFEPGFGNELATHRTMMRFYYETFDISKEKISFNDFVLSIGMEFLDFQLKIPPEVTISLADAIVNNWYKELQTNKSLKNKLKTVNKQLPEIEDWDVEELKLILKDHEKMRRAYFKSFEHVNGVKTIRVWYPAPNENWIRWDEKYSIDIKVNPMLGMALGFFRKGYDYSLIETDKTHRLKFAAISSSKERETAQFKTSTLCIGEKGGKVFWAW